MAFVSDRYKFLFVMSPRTGCTSFAYGIMVPHLFVCRVPWKDILDDDGRQLVDSKHSTIPDLLRYGLMTREQVAGLLTVCAVRNPFDSLVSLYAKNTTTYAKLVDEKDSFLQRKPAALEDVRRAANMSFGEWVAERYRSARPQHMYARYLEGVDHVMRFEHLHQDIEELLRKIGAPAGLTMPNINPTERDEDYRSYYTDEARAIVERVFAPDAERFGYRF